MAGSESQFFFSRMNVNDPEFTDWLKDIKSEVKENSVKYTDVEHCIKGSKLLDIVCKSAGRHKEIFKNAEKTNIEKLINSWINSFTLTRVDTGTYTFKKNGYYTFWHKNKSNCSSSSPNSACSSSNSSKSENRLPLKSLNISDCGDCDNTFNEIQKENEHYLEKITENEENEETDIKFIDDETLISTDFGESKNKPSSSSPMKNDPQTKKKIERMSRKIFATQLRECLKRRLVDDFIDAYFPISCFVPRTVEENALSNGAQFYNGSDGFTEEIKSQMNILSTPQFTPNQEYNSYECSLYHDIVSYMREHACPYVKGDFCKGLFKGIFRLYVIYEFNEDKAVDFEEMLAETLYLAKGGEEFKKSEKQWALVEKRVNQFAFEARVSEQPHGCFMRREYIEKRRSLANPMSDNESKNGGGSVQEEVCCNDNSLGYISDLFTADFFDENETLLLALVDYMNLSLHILPPKDRSRLFLILCFLNGIVTCDRLFLARNVMDQYQKILDDFVPIIFEAPSPGPWTDVDHSYRQARYILSLLVRHYVVIFASATRFKAHCQNLIKYFMVKELGDNVVNMVGITLTPINKRQNVSKARNTHISIVKLIKDIIADPSKSIAEKQDKLAILKKHHSEAYWEVLKTDEKAGSIIKEIMHQDFVTSVTTTQSSSLSTACSSFAGTNNTTTAPPSSVPSVTPSSSNSSKLSAFFSLFKKH